MKRSFVHRLFDKISTFWWISINLFLFWQSVPYRSAITPSAPGPPFLLPRTAVTDPEEFDPEVTLWAFLSQVLFKGELRICLAAMSRMAVLLVALGWPACAKSSGAYCQGRRKIPTSVIRSLATHLADRAKRCLPHEWVWCGRHIKLVDGFTVSMPDTEVNQQEYPQAKT